MKKLISNGLMRAIAALSMFSFVGCADFGGIDSQPEQGLNFVTDALSAYTMEAESAENVIFSISSNTPWRIELDDEAEWLHVSPTMSATGGLVADIALSADDNLYHTSRSATITITVPELPECNKTITINQDSKTDLTVDTFSGTVPAAGGEVVISVTTNKAWEYVAEDDFLADVTIVKESATGEGNGEESGDDVAEPATRTYVAAPAPEFDELETYILTINVALNTGVERTGTFKVRLVGGRGEEGKDLQTREIAQSGIELRLPDDEPDPVFEAVMDGDDEDANVLYPAYGPGATVTFNVRSSIAFDAVPVDDWIEVVNVTNEERNGMVTGGTVTLKTKGDINTFVRYRSGIVNLTADGLKPVPITIYQPSPVKFSFPFTTDPEAADSVVDNGDGSATIRFGSKQNETVLYLPETGKLGSWTYEFDPERTSIENVHLYFAFQATLGDGSSNGCRSALTPYQAAPAGSGVTNNFIMNNHAGTFATTPQRWNLDGVQINTFPVKQGDEALPVEAVKKIEKVTYEFGTNGIAIRIVAAGKTYEAEMPLTNPGTQFDAYKNAVTDYKANFRYTDPMGVRPFDSEYITITKFYFTPAE